MNPTVDLRKRAWRKSTYSNPSGNCVEVAENIPGLVAVRDSKHPEIGHLEVDSDEWRAIVEQMKIYFPNPVSNN